MNSAKKEDGIYEAGTQKSRLGGATFRWRICKSSVLFCDFFHSGDGCIDFLFGSEGSDAEANGAVEVEGAEYPVVKVEISNTSHPYYTGKVKIVDTAGRVDKFYQRYKSRQK